MKTPKVSVVIPIFNAEATLERAVKSILGQTYFNLELILVNNASTDSSEEIAKKIAASDARVVILTESQKGVTYAANTGNAYATGKFIARMDADDYSLPTRIEKQVELLQAKPEIGVASCLAKHIGHHPKTEGLGKFVDWANSVVSPEQIFLNRFVEAPVINPTALFRRELLEQYGGYLHGDFPEDYELWLRWLNAGVKIEKVPEILFDWYDSDTRLTRTDNRYSTEAFYRIKSKYLSKIILQQAPNRPIWVWGAGRLTRQRVKMLQDEGVQIAGFIDVKKRVTGQLPCTSYEQFDWGQPVFIVSYVGNWGARDNIRTFLLSKRKVEGPDFILVA